MSYTEDYSDVDPVLAAWTQERGLRIHTKYKGEDVRSIDVAGGSGKLYQIWVDAPDVNKKFGIHAWDYKKRRADVKCSLSDLKKVLEEVYATVLEWDEDFSKELAKHGQ
jgi:hypothetical protein